METMRQTAAYPTLLAELVERTTYKPGWSFWLEDFSRGQNCEGLTLIIETATQDSNPPHLPKGVTHLFVVPAAAYDERSWRRWLFDRLVDVETHEAAEFFKLGGVRPYAPSHGPGNDPYMIRELGEAADVETDFRGRRKEKTDAGSGG